MPNKKFLSITISTEDLNLIQDALNFLKNDVIVHSKKHLHNVSEIDGLLKELKSDRWYFDTDFIDCSEY